MCIFKLIGNNAGSNKQVESQNVTVSFTPCLPFDLYFPH